MARATTLLGSGPPAFIDTRLAEAFLGVPIILGEIEVVLNERSADVRGVTDAVAWTMGLTSGSVHKKRSAEFVCSDEKIHRGAST